MIMRNCYIAGFMGTGKTTVGKIIAERLKKPFVETDEEIVRSQKASIADIFSKHGEAYFRKLEKEILLTISSGAGQIISCGGGLMCAKENLALMKSTGMIFTLDAKPENIYQRLKNDTTRPLLRVDDPLAEIQKLLRLRDHYYLQADHCISTEFKQPIEIACEIIAIMKKDGFLRE